ncbi:hypothetical protein, partial [Kineosporia sp. NBRC 101731]|uniref:hypothetical protein n=1 Tax=Kineosporia sp. NBRC 101731 TaxID=3032199 RepID=UPI0025548809
EPAVEKLIEKDLMNSTERTARRTRRWQNDLAWHANRQDRLRRAAASVSSSPVGRPSPRPPWGEGTEKLADYGSPPF